MKTIELAYAEVVDMQEICDLLIENGYRLIKVMDDDEEDGADPSCCSIP